MLGRMVAVVVAGMRDELHVLVYICNNSPLAID